LIVNNSTEILDQSTASIPPLRYLWPKWHKYFAKLFSPNNMALSFLNKLNNSNNNRSNNNNKQRQNQDRLSLTIPIMLTDDFLLNALKINNRCHLDYFFICFAKISELIERRVTKNK
jgi:hypothetical protein